MSELLPKGTSALLDEATKRNDIGLEYEDIWGKTHRISTSTRRNLLGAMGIPAHSELGLSVALAEAQSRRCRRVLPPVLVVRQGGAIRVELTLPEGNEARVFSWAVLEEDGALHDGRLVPGELKKLGVTEQGDESFVRYGLEIPVSLPLGYHRLAIEPADGSPTMTAGMALICTPPRCYRPGALREGRRVWGTAIQLYALRSARNWGIGDFSDLADMVQLCAELGAAVVGLNPLHAMFPHNPWHCSPYSPSSRLFLNTVYIDVEAVPEFALSREAREILGSDEFQQRLATARAREIIEYGEVGSLKRWMLEALYREFQARHIKQGSKRAEAFHAFVEQQGEALRLHALFEALQEHFHTKDHEIWGWQVWPEDYRDPRSEAALAFAVDHEERVQFFQYLQWVADEQLSRASALAADLGLGIGLYTDLAVSVDRAGAEVWGNQQVFADTAAAGAPPDALAPQGQNWGLPPMIPQRLRDAEYAPFVAVLRANMRHAGALRIDHVMGLLRLYWVAQGRSAAEGGYVHYPFEDLVALVALESHRNGCLVIGEDLGTVPQEIRRTLRQWGVLSYRLMPFEYDKKGALTAPEDYPRQALVAASTHDLPPVAGMWSGRDIDWRCDLGIFVGKEREDRERANRAKERGAFLSALQKAGLLDEGDLPDVRAEDAPTEALLLAVQRYLAATPAQLMMVQWEDILGVQEQVNLPGTTDEHPNWKRRLPLNVEELKRSPLLRQLAGELSSRPPAPRRTKEKSTRLRRRRRAKASG
ncbi:MAG: 4-alpha-glucanotransferase [Deltaproteobacteria bacterium]|nr:4-alpha-glucanotransferase [Deltaproteobacteria bacterium]